jgi:protein-S-isoprenylcysteine O-methyltransferase Ste14
MHNDLIKRVREEEQRMIKKNPEYVEYRREVWSGIIGMY